MAVVLISASNIEIIRPWNKMVYGIQGLLGYSTANQRDTVRAQIEAELASEARWGVDIIESVDFPGHRWGDGTSSDTVPVVRLGVRLTTKAGQDRVFSRLAQVLSGPRLPSDSSWLGIHDCVDDEVHTVCPEPDYRQWQGGALVDIPGKPF